MHRDARRAVHLQFAERSLLSRTSPRKRPTESKPQSPADNDKRLRSVAIFGSRLVQPTDRRSIRTDSQGGAIRPVNLHELATDKPIITEFGPDLAPGLTIRHPSGNGESIFFIKFGRNI